jgi:hypothetical protein
MDQIHHKQLLQGLKIRQEDDFAGRSPRFTSLDFQIQLEVLKHQSQSDERQFRLQARKSVETMQEVSMAICDSSAEFHVKVLEPCQIYYQELRQWSVCYFQVNNVRNKPAPCFIRTDLQLPKS